MGVTIRLTCNDCKKSYDLKVGQGMMDYSLERVLKHFDDKTADLIRAKLSLPGTDDSWYYRTMIGYCSSCRTFREIPTLKIKDNGKDYVTVGKCSCGNTCELIDDDDKARMNDLKCPGCSGTMTATIAGMWD